MVGVNKDGFAFAHHLTDKASEGTVDEGFNIGNRAPRFVVGFSAGFSCWSFCRSDTNAHAIAGKYLEHFIGRNEYLASIVHDRKTVAVQRPFDRGLDVLFLCLNLVFEPLQLGQGIIVQHGLESLLTT